MNEEPSSKRVRFDTQNRHAEGQLDQVNVDAVNSINGVYAGQVTGSTGSVDEKTVQDLTRSIDEKYAKKSTKTTRSVNGKQIERSHEKNKKDIHHVLKSTPVKRSISSKTDSPSHLMTKFETFITDTKNTYPGTFILFERAFRYFMYGEDARYVGTEFGKTVVKPRKSGQDGLFSYTSVRQENLAVLVKQLVERGLKVGIVEQTESGVIKQASTNGKGRLIERKLTRIYTRGTFVDDISNEIIVGKSSHSTMGYLLGITENPQQSPDVYSFSIVAAIVSTGEVMTDTFEDDSMFQELDKRLSLLRPCEILLVGSVHENARRLIKRYTLSTKYPLRLETREREEAHVAQEYFIEKFGNNETVLDQYLSLDQSILVCLHGLSAYVTEYGVSLGTNLSSFSLKTSVFLTKNTLENLDIMNSDQNSPDAEGSLVWLIDQTHTSFGQRLFKKWIKQPLTIREKIEERLDAVSEMRVKTHLIKPMLKIVDRLSDLESDLTKLELNKIKSHHLFYFLDNLQRISEINLTNFKSSMLSRIFKTLPLAKSIVEKYLKYIHKDHLEDMNAYFTEEYDEYEKIDDEKVLAGEIQHRIEQYLNQLKESTGINKLTYSKGKTKMNLLQVEKHLDSKVPNSWIKEEATKTKSLYTTIELDELRQELAVADAKAVETGNQVYKDFLREIAKQSDIFRHVITAIAELDCLISLTSTSDEFVRPTFVDEQILEIKNSWNPIINSQIGTDRTVRSDVSMTVQKNRVCIISGPNMGGKSSFAKQLGMTVLMAQIGSFVPASQAVMGIFDGIFTRMGASDKIFHGQSTFMVEMTECSEILHKATDQSLILLDEIGRGTSSIDGSAIAYSVLRHLITETKALVIFITHYPEVTALSQSFEGEVSNWHASYMQRTDVLHCIQLLYRLASGAAKSSFGLNVAEMAEIPNEIIQQAKNMSKLLKSKYDLVNKHKRNVEICRLMSGQVGDEIDLQQIVKFAKRNGQKRSKASKTPS